MPFMFFKTRFTFLTAILSSLGGYAQVLDIDEKKPAMENGFEYGYIINNEQLKMAKGEEYSRYEITLYITNKSNCTKMYADKTSLLSFESPNLLATFNCRNANGKRFTSKNGTIKARDFYVKVKQIINGKETTETVKAGYTFRNGETQKDNIIVLVPKGERPQIQCTPNTLPEW